MFFFLFVVDQIFSRLYLGIHRFLFLDTEVWKNMFLLFPDDFRLKGWGCDEQKEFFFILSFFTSRCFSLE